MDDIKKLLGRRIKELRQIKKLSQQVLAEKAGIEQRSLSHIECGNNFPSKSLMNIASALDISLPELFDFEHLDLTSDEMLKFIEAKLASMTSEEIQIIYRLMKSFR